MDVIFNNAAIFVSSTIDNVSTESWLCILDVNVLGCALTAKAVVPLLKNNLQHIVQTKGTVLQMTRNLALDLGQFNIQCNAICSGTIVTTVTIKLAADSNLTMEQFAAQFLPIH